MTIRTASPVTAPASARAPATTAPWEPTGMGGFFFIVALIFVYRSFHGMRIPEDK